MNKEDCERAFTFEAQKYIEVLCNLAMLNRPNEGWTSINKIKLDLHILFNYGIYSRDIRYWGMNPFYGISQYDENIETVGKNQEVFDYFNKEIVDLYNKVIIYKNYQYKVNISSFKEHILSILSDSPIDTTIFKLKDDFVKNAFSIESIGGSEISKVVIPIELAQDRSFDDSRYHFKDKVYAMYKIYAPYCSTSTLKVIAIPLKDLESIKGKIAKNNAKYKVLISTINALLGR